MDVCVCVRTRAYVFIHKIIRISGVKAKLLRKAHTVFLCFFSLVWKLVLYLGFSRAG